MNACNWQVDMQGLMSQEDWETASTAALRLFAYGQEQAAARGLLLVDTKYEFGRDASGCVMLIDEVHTPDSSRYWLAESYEDRFAASQVRSRFFQHVVGMQQSPYVVGYPASYSEVHNLKQEKHRWNMSTCPA